METLLLDRQRVDEIRRIEQVTGRNDMLVWLVGKLEENVTAFRASFLDYVARDDASGAVRAAHTLKGTCRQLGAEALGDLFAEIERFAKDGDYAAAQRTFDGGAGLIAQSLTALKQA
jgi:HPt (histidine-containing phosphotransfer) domain-containing protein